MKLVHTKLNFDVLEFNDDQTIIYDKHLKTEMEEIGIQIPFFIQKQYLNRSVIKLDDKLFQKAFKEVYYPFVLDETKYKWVK